MIALASALLLASSAQARLTGASRQLQEIGDMEGTLTAPTDEFSLETPAACTSVMAGCTGTFVGKSHDVAGEVTVIDDCTFRIQGWEFDGLGPAVEWWGAKQVEDPEFFNYEGPGAKKIGELGSPGNYVAGEAAGGSGDVTVRLGQDAQGQQILLSPDLNHISLWCFEFNIDFGNAALECPPAGAATPAAGPAEEPGAAPEPAPGGTTGTSVSTGTTPTDPAPADPSGTPASPAGSTPTETTSATADGTGASGEQAPSDSAPASTSAAHRVVGGLGMVVGAALVAAAL